MTDSLHTRCRVPRQILAVGNTFDATTSKWSVVSRDVVHTDPCGRLLGSDDDMVLGVCRCCCSGWKTESNKPTKEGVALIAEALARREGRA